MAKSDDDLDVGVGGPADVAARADKQCLTTTAPARSADDSLRVRGRGGTSMNDICDDRRYPTTERPSMPISMTLLFFITQGVFAHATMREAPLQRLSFLYFIVYVSLSPFLFGLPGELTWPPLEDRNYRTSRVCEQFNVCWAINDLFHTISRWNLAVFALGPLSISSSQQ